MNEGVFFVVEAIGWQGNFDISAFFLAIIFTSSIFLLQKFGQYIKTRKKIPNIHIFPKVSESNFSEKVFQGLQIIAKEKYLPENSLAHTTNDIAKYCNNKKFLCLYNKIEKSLFRGISFSEKERIEILSEIKNIIKNF